MRAGQFESRSAYLSYGVAVLSAGVLAALKWGVGAKLGQDAPFLLSLAPTLVTAYYGGVGPGILAAVLCTASVGYFYLSPIEDFRATAVPTIHVVVFGIESLTVAALMASIQVSRQRAERAARRIDGIYTVSSALGGTQSVEEIAEVVLHEAVGVLGGMGVAIYGEVEGRASMRLISHKGIDSRYSHLAKLPMFQEVPSNGDFPVPLAARTRAVVVSEDEASLRRRFTMLDEASASQPLPGALACAPMMCRGHVVGVLVVAFDKPRHFSLEDRSWMQAVAQDCGMAMERAHLFETELRARTEAEQASRTKDEFLAIVSNELRAPLTSIIGWAHTLKSRDGTDMARYRHGLDVIERSAQAQARLVDDVLDMSRIVANRLKVDLKSVELGGLVTAAVEELRVMAAAKGIALDMGAEVRATVVGDEQRLAQVLRIVITNSFKFTHPGGHVRVDMDTREHRAFVCIKDDGRGIDAAEIAHLFEGFRTPGGPAARPEGGLGLGLRIAKHIIQEHKGALRIHSPGQGRGTVVTVELPIADPTAGVLSMVNEDSSKSREARPLAGLRVLVVDDDDDAREALAEMLSGDGAEVRWATNVNSALREIEGFCPGVLVGDLTMKDEDLMKLIRDVRSQGKERSGIPALALTGDTGPEHVRALLQAGYQTFLPKPFEPRALTKAVRELSPNKPEKAA